MNNLLSNENILKYINQFSKLPYSQGLSMFFISSVTLTIILQNAFSKSSAMKIKHNSNIHNSNICDSEKTIQNKIDYYFEKDTELIQSQWIENDHKHEYLKEVLGDQALEWVKKRNEHALSYCGNPMESSLYKKILSILDSNEKIPYLRKYNDLYYNFWQDKTNPRGIWRRISMESYLSSSPQWEIVLDLDELGRLEGESWVHKGHIVYEPDPIIDHTTRITRTMIQLSRGGADAVVMREFDLDLKTFVSEDKHAFYIPESKTRVAWKSKDILLVGTDFNRDGTSMTDSGYPRIMKEWHRGTSLRDSKVIHEGEQSDVSVFMYMNKHGKHRYLLKGRAITFYTSVNYILLPSTSILPSYPHRIQSDVWYDLKVPLDSQISIFSDQLLIQLRSTWERTSQLIYNQGSLLVVPLEAFVLDPLTASMEILFEPSTTMSLESFASTKNYLILEILDKVKSKYAFWKYIEGSESPLSVQDTVGRWVFCGEESCKGSSLSAVDSHNSDEYWLTSETFLCPTKLQLGDASLGPIGLEQVKVLKSLPAQFDADGFMEQQFEAISADGTKIPYFLIYHHDMVFNGCNPTLLYGYGGFEISLTPTYAAVVGAGWLQQSTPEEKVAVGEDETVGVNTPLKEYNCFVMANIRGGGEFGPSWHQAALKENRKLAYDDFIAVAEDLITRKVTNPMKLGIRGGSNGGLLMGNMMVRRPDLFAAVCCAVPLLDMKSYHKLLAGASWMAEYGDPDSDDWSFLKNYSAYHNINPQVGKTNGPKYPYLLMTTSTKDDRVHPYHARCFVKRLLECYENNHNNEVINKMIVPYYDKKVFYYENIEGGHGGAADNKQQAFMSVLYLNFLKEILCNK